MSYCLIVAQMSCNAIMAVRHKGLAIVSVNFLPFLWEEKKNLVVNHRHKWHYFIDFFVGDLFLIFFQKNIFIKMYFLPTEIKLDILKHLNPEQLLNVQQTNYYLKNFIEEYKKELARKKFYWLHFSVFFRRHRTDFLTYKLFQPDPKLYDFELSRELEEKWKCAIKRRIPVFFYPEHVLEMAYLAVYKSSHKISKGLLAVVYFPTPFSQICSSIPLNFEQQDKQSTSPIVTQNLVILSYNHLFWENSF
ncbi:unnamed protein product [Meloidogyne enterolobii]|uniref:Uncharacterized protein n=1 Tax=Meloidogyne enterolobii TaxID=390850 RepID=A0ACB1B6T7_MELEN